MRGVVLSETEGVKAYKLSLPTTALVQKIESDKAQVCDLYDCSQILRVENPQVKVLVR